MPETKLKLKDPGTIHLMALDTSSLFLPFGRPIADYLRGSAGPQNGSRALLHQGAIDFSPVVRWTESMAALLRTTGFGELERDALVIPDAPPPQEESDPGMAEFLSFDEPELAPREGDQAKISPAIASDDVAISLPRVSALPLRPRMTFGPAPASKVKPAPVVAQKPAPPPVVKAGPVIVPKATPPAPPKPVAVPAPPQKVAAPAAVQPKPVTTIPTPVAAPVSKPPVAPAAKPVTPVAPAARAPEVTPVQPKSSPTPVRTPIAPAARATENVVSTVEAPPMVKPAPIVAPKATPIATPKPPAPAAPAPTTTPRVAGRSPWTEPAEAPARETTTREIPRETPREREPEPRAKASGSLSLLAPSQSPSQTSDGPNLNLGDTDSGGFLEKIPMVAKIGIGLLLAVVVLYFLFGRSGGEKTAAPQTAAVSVGEQGWSTEWASDTGGSKRGRQITLYRPSTGMTDYQFKFVGQIETKAIGWVFRAADTKNYYAMKIETLRPGAMAISHFAVVEGRESSFSQKPLAIDARPGAAYRVTLDVSGPRFTVSVNNEPVEFWTDNRLKAGAVGFMNERDERGASSSVQFAFPQRGR